jgi:hypothetical protein
MPYGLEARREADWALVKRAALGVYSFEAPHRTCQGSSAARVERAGAAGESAAGCLTRRTRGWLSLAVHQSYAGGDPVGSAARRAVPWTCSHDTGHIWEEILPHPSESMVFILKDLRRC